MIEGSFYIDKIIYHDDKSDFLIMSTTMGGLSYVLLGNCNALEGETIKAKVEEVIHPKFGKQYSICSYEKEDSLDIESTSNYILEKIFDSYEDKEKFNFDKMKDIVLSLLDLNFNYNLIIKICSKYKNKTLSKIKSNPYNIIYDFDDLDFNFVDKIALNLGFEEDSNIRINALIIYILVSSENLNGNVFIEYEDLKYKLYEYFGKEIINLDDFLCSLQLDKKIYILNYFNKKFVYLYENYILEKNLSLILFERKQYINIITGGPGTGKTTMLNQIANKAIEDGKKVLLLAPTGRAAKRMFEATKIEAKTIHRALEFTSDNHKHYFKKNENNKLEVDTLIVDEMSMVDYKLFYYLMIALNPDTLIYLVGDKNQLPSVGSGQVLSDLINSKLFDTKILTKIHRQSENSYIVKNAHKILNNEEINLDEKYEDFSFVKIKDASFIIKIILDILDYFIKNNLYSKNDIQILCSTKKGEVGTVNLNKILQNKLNPKNVDTKEINLYNQIFRVNDKVMQNKNNYDLFWEIKNSNGLVIDEGYGIFNGDMGEIIDIDKDNLEITINFDGKIVVYNYEDIKDIILSYAITVHKSQGSEYPLIIFPMYKASYFLLNKNLLYTGLTRAKNNIIFVGDQNIFLKMSKNEAINKRNSLLCNDIYY